MTIGTRKRRWTVYSLIIAAVCVALAIVTGPIWLPAIGRSLVLADRQPEDGALTVEVLAVPASPWVPRGPSFARLVRAADLIRGGRATRVVMTCGTVYGVSGCELAQRELTARSYPRLPMSEVSLESSPDVVEADAILDEVSRIGVKSVAVLVAPFESRRLNRVYRREGDKRGIKAIIIPVADPGFDPGAWLTSRELRKDVAYELFQWIGVP